MRMTETCSVLWFPTMYPKRNVSSRSSMLESSTWQSFYLRTDVCSLRKLRLSGGVDFIAGRIEYFRAIIGDLYLSIAEIESEGSGLEQPYFLC
jgi:hypothetical protein